MRGQAGGRVQAFAGGATAVRGRNIWQLWAGLGLVLLWLPSVSAQVQGFVLYVNNTDATCDGHSPCFVTIQAAVDAAYAKDTVSIQAGNYAEQVVIRNKNIHTDASEADRLVIEADPAAPPGSVVLVQSTSGCSSGEALRIQHTKFVTVRGLSITGAGGQAIRIMGGDKQNQAIHLERNRIFGNGISPCHGGITVGRGNPHTLIINNLIYGNTRSGIASLDGSGGPHYVMHNTIHSNGWNGIELIRYHQALLINNVITRNGVASDAINNGFGVRRETAANPPPTDLSLFHNLVCGNASGELHGPLLDSTDASNLTPTGTEGEGVTASLGCDIPANVCANVPGPDGLVNTADDDFVLMLTSRALDKGIDPRTLGLSLPVASLMADFVNDSGRPADGDSSGAAQFDMGAVELAAPTAGLQYVPVPLVVGLSEAVARARLEAAGVTMGAINRVSSAMVPAGQVSGQTPVAGAEVLGGTPVDLEVLIGVGSIAVPQLIGLTETAAVGALAAATLTLGNSHQAYSATVPAGQVLSQTPVAGTQVSSGTVVHIVMSAGMVDIDPPVLTIVVPGASAINEPISLIRVTYRDAGAGVDLTSLRILLDGMDITSACFNKGAAMASCDELAFAAGPHHIEVNIRDLAGNLATVTTQVTQDATPPQVSIDAPADGLVTTAATIQVTGTVSDNQGSGDLRVAVNGMVAQVSNGRFVAAAVPLARGLNTIRAVALDQAGNMAATTITVTFHDLSAPISSNILAPTDGTVLSGFDVTVHGTIDNIAGHETGVTVNGVVAFVYGGQFVANHVPLQEGDNVITVVATDSADHTETTAITLYRDMSEGYVRLTANTYAGLAPFEAILQLEGPVDITASSITVTDAANAQVIASANETEYIVRLSAAGLYFLTAEVTDLCSRDSYLHDCHPGVRQRHTRYGPASQVGWHEAGPGHSRYSTGCKTFHG